MSFHFKKCLVGVFLFSIFVTSMAGAAADWVYHSEQAHFSVNLPSGWVKNTQKITIKHQDVAFQDTHSKTFIFIKITDAPVTPEFYYPGLKRALFNKLIYQQLNSPIFADDQKHYMEISRTINLNGKPFDEEEIIFFGSKKIYELYLANLINKKTLVQNLVPYFITHFHIDTGFAYPDKRKVPVWAATVLLALKFSKLIFGLLVLGVAYFVGIHNEKKHYKSIIAREANYIHLPVLTSNLKTVLAGDSIDSVVHSHLATGSVVSAADSFRTFLSKLIGIVGGNLTPYQSMMDRARREAILRMQADAVDADMIVNVRIQSHSIGSTNHDARRKKSAKAIEVFAYGTAIKLKKEA